MIKLSAYQKDAIGFLEKYRTAILLWRRQGGKSTLFAWMILKQLLKSPGSLITFVSASMSVGSEMPYKATDVFNSILGSLREFAQNSLDIDSNGEGLEEQELLKLFEQCRLEIRIHHSKTVISRMKVIAPNISTARGYSGWVFMDEIGYIPKFKGLFEAVEPIISRDPSFRLYMATTPPDDDAHFSYELAAPDPGVTFKSKATGNRYFSQAHVPVHRVDAWDAHLAGIKLYDRHTGAALTPEEHRAQAIDRDAWDRNYGLKWLAGGRSALGLSAIAEAQERGAQLGCVAGEREIPVGWAEKMTDQPYTIGYDPATTEKETSNPSSIVVNQQTGPREYAERLVVRFKTADDNEALAILKEVVEAAMAKSGAKPKRLAIDGTSERYFSVRVKRELSKYCTVEIVVSSETVMVGGEKMTRKAYLGNLYSAAYEDGQLAIPPDRWVKEDRRLTKRVKGTFDNEVDSAGNHADTFDAGKLALYAQTKRGGPVEFKPVSTGGGAISGRTMFG